MWQLAGAAWAAGGRPTAAVGGGRACGSRCSWPAPPVPSASGAAAAGLDATGAAIAAGAAAGGLLAAAAGRRRPPARRGLQRSAVTAGAEVDTAPKVSPLHGPELGVVASGNLSAGELVVSERPLLTFSGTAFGLAQEQYDSLPSFAQEAVMQLRDGTAGDAAGKTLFGIVSSSRLPRCTGSIATVVCPTISRFRHSCNPNCEQSWDEETQQERVYTSTFVREGEELFLPYVDIQAPIVERTRALWDGYRYRCKCKDCMTTDTEGDHRRVRMRQLQQKVEGAVEDGAEGPDARRSLDWVLDLLELYDEEEFHSKSLREKACYNAFQLSLKAGDVQEANRWVVKAYQNAMVARGKEHKDTKRLKEYVLTPESHPAYRGEQAPEANAILVVGFLAVLLILLWFLLA
mmetsp:Transcript_55965/g.175552  ORF Transcript_55965/g.175552 Transcript_55965/m.175552 type:complete len:404 (+) Transcript_55965:22-1233(+)